MQNILSACIIFTMLHAYHVSVTDINWNKDERRLEISTRIFADDLEKAIEEQTGQKVDLLSSPEKASEQVFKYLQSRFFIKSNHKPVPLELVGSEAEGDAIWIFFQSARIRKGKEITVTNRILTETFSDQQNIVHYKYESQRKSLKFNKREPEGTFSFRKENR